MVNIKDKVLVITGGASGLGKSIAEILLAAGASVSILDLIEPTVNGLEKYSDRLLFVHADICNENEVQKALVDTKAKFGRIDGLIHSAAYCANHFGFNDSIYDQEQKKPGDFNVFVKNVTVNLLGTLNVNRLVIPFFLENKPDEETQKGIIINITSVVGHEPLSSELSYSASKAAVISLTYPLAKDLGPLGIRVMDIAPGLCESPMLSRAIEANPDVAALHGPFPPRPAKPAELAKVIIDIIENPMLNGFSLRFDGALRI